jgi:hypothetical protein
MQKQIKELRQMRDRIDVAIRELEGIESRPADPIAPYDPGIRGQWTPEARRKHSEAMKLAWKTRRRN